MKYVSWRPPEKQNWQDTEISKIYLGNWFTQLWRLRSPITQHLQAREPGKPIVSSVSIWRPQNGTRERGYHWLSKSYSPKTEQPEAVICKGKTRDTPAQERIHLFSIFYSIHALNWLDDTHLHCEGQTFFTHSLLIQVLISSHNILTNMPKNNMLLAFWTFLCLVHLHGKLTIIVSFPIHYFYKPLSRH
jgi:hypothetical protein